MGLVRDIALKLLRVDFPVPIAPSNGYMKGHRKETSKTGTPPSSGDEAYLPDSTRLENYRLFASMERDPVIQPALNNYADEVVSGTAVSSAAPFIINTNSKAAGAAIDIFQRTVKIQQSSYLDYIYDLCHDIGQFGDVVWEVVTDKRRVLEFVNLLPESMRYIKFRERWKLGDESEEVKIASHYQQYQRKGGWVTFEDWQIAHFRGVKSLSKHWAYTASVLWPVQSIWKLLHYGIEAVAIDRIYSAHHARLWLVDTGELSGAAAWEHLEILKTLYAREQRTDPDTGDLLLSGGIQMPEEDVWAPHGGGNKTEVRELYGSRFRPITDIEFMLTLLCVGLGVPPQRLGILKEVRTRAVMHTVYIQFAKNVNRIRLAVERGLGKALRIQLGLAGLNPEQHPFWFSWPPISAELELRRIETLKLRAEITKLLTAEAMITIPDEWIYREVLGISEDEIQVFKKATPRAPPPELKKKRGTAESLQPEHWITLLQSPVFAESLSNLKVLFNWNRMRTHRGDYRVT